MAGTGEQRFFSKYGTSITASLGLCLLLTEFIPRPVLNCHPNITAFLAALFGVLPKLGDAFLVAAVLAVVVDQATKQSLVRDVVEAAAPKLIGRHLPEPLQTAMLGYLELNVIRPEFDIEYGFTTTKDPNFLCVSSRLRGGIKSFSPREESYTFIAGVDESITHPSLGVSEIPRVSMIEESTGRELIPQDALKDAIANNILKQEDGSLLFVQKVILSPGGRYFTVVEMIEYHPAVSSSIPLFSAKAVVKATVRARYAPLDLVVNLQVPFVNEQLKPENSLWGREWNVYDPLLPGQSMLLTFHQRNLTQPVAQVNAAPPPPAINPPTIQQS